MVEEGSGGEREGLNSLRLRRGADHGESSWLWEDLGFYSE